jgi:hypothetical protein
MRVIMVKINWHDWFLYDETSKSCLRWKVDRRGGKDYHIVMVSAGDECGYQDSFGHFQVDLMNKARLCHRIIWEMHNEPLQVGEFIDHINGLAEDNKLQNLRVVDRKGNGRNRCTNSNNTSGAQGVAISMQLGYKYWQAYWSDLEGKRKGKNFSVLKHGNDEAFRLACLYREAMIASLNEQGAGYTHDHGKR